MVIRPQMVLFGDSITEQSFRPCGWGAALADTYSRKMGMGKTRTFFSMSKAHELGVGNWQQVSLGVADVVVRGYGGYNTRWALFLLKHLFPLSSPTPPVTTTIFFGANDAALLGRTSERQHVPVEEYKENLRKIIQHLKEWSTTMLVVLITPPPIDEDGRKEYARALYGEKAMKLPERTNEVAGVYAKKCIELAKELHLPYIDLWSQMQEIAGWQKKFLSDGLHLTEEGNAVVHKEVVRVLEEACLCAQDMQYDFPHHSEIDGYQPEKAFQQKKS